MKKSVTTALAFPVLAWLMLAAAGAADFRTSTRIMTPAPLPEGARTLSRPVPVDRKVVDKAIRELFDAYSHNPAALGKLLSRDFLDRDRFLASMSEKLPRDATLRPLAVRSIQTLRQYVAQRPAGGEELVSMVTATVQGQLRFNDPVQGPQRLEGTSEYLLQVRQPIVQGATGPADRAR